ncbi:hypothetical protein A0123_01928 [Gluconobacter cerinus]|uniref:Transposase n=1 Tax=Gluconobacter cerinus TaxID=38307 RepID=A0A1B6VJC8_9PROT|nr:hypothetical protein A0123_01928 [Gluconobacter cerinus]
MFDIITQRLFRNIITRAILCWLSHGRSLKTLESQLGFFSNHLSRFYNAMRTRIQAVH